MPDTPADEPSDPGEQRDATTPPDAERGVRPSTPSDQRLVPEGERPVVADRDGATPVVRDDVPFTRDPVRTAGSPVAGVAAGESAADRARADREAGRQAAPGPQTQAKARERAKVLADVEPEPGVAKPDPILTVDGVSRSFGGLKAVDVEHLELQRGVITALIGPNGAGKTTFFNLLCGFDKPDTGTRTFNGEDLGRTASHRIAQMGMVRTFQLTKALTRLTVMENMLLGETEQPGESLLGAFRLSTWRAKERESVERAEELLERFQLTRMRDEYAGTLSGGQRKLLEMARSLMVDPELVLLDEPMAGVNPALTESLLGHVVSLPDDGMSVIFVEHDMDVVMDISDWVVVMAQGRIIAEGPPRQVAKNPEVIDAYLGAHHEDKSAYETGPAERVVRSTQGANA